MKIKLDVDMSVDDVIYWAWVGLGCHFRHMITLAPVILSVNLLSFTGAYLTAKLWYPLQNG